MNIALNSGWSLWALLVEFICLNTFTMRYFHQSWSPHSAFAVSGEPARRVNRATGGVGHRSPPPKVDICFKSDESLAKSAYFPLLALKEPLRSISSSPKQLGSILTRKCNLLQLQVGFIQSLWGCSIFHNQRDCDQRGLPVHFLHVCTHQLFLRWGWMFNFA